MKYKINRFSTLTSLAVGCSLAIASAPPPTHHKEFYGRNSVHIAASCAMAANLAIRGSKSMSTSKKSNAHGSTSFWLNLWDRNFCFLLFPEDFELLLPLPLGGGGPALPPAPGLPRHWMPSLPVTDGVINLATGDLAISKHIVGWSCVGEGVGFDLIYNSESTSTGAYGNGIKNSYSWSVSGSNPVRITRPDGSTDVYTVNGSTYVPPAGVYMSLTKSQSGTFVLTDKIGTSYNFNSNGTLGSISDRNGNSTTLTYLGSGSLGTVTDQAGRNLTLAYDVNGRLSSATDCIGRIWTFLYDSSGDLTSVTQPQLGGKYYSDSFTYSAPGEISSSTDRDGNRSYFSLGTGGVVIAWTNPLGDQTSVVYSAGSQQNAMGAGPTGPKPYPLGTVSVAETSDSIGLSSSFGVDGAGRILAKRDALGNQTTFTWDSNNYQTSRVLPGGETSSVTYDGFGNRLSSTNGLGQVTSMSYDSLNDLVSLTLPCGCSTYWSYDSIGNPTSYTSGTGVVTSYSVNSSGKIIKITDSLGNATQMAYDVYGNMTSAKNALGNVIAYTFSNQGLTMATLSRPGDAGISYSYDGWLRETGETSGSQTESKTLDPVGRVLTDSSPETGVTSQDYDALGDLTSRTTSAGTSNYTYNVAGFPLTGTDSTGAQYSQTYDAAGRVITGVGPGNTSNYSYDADSRVVSEVDSTGITTDFSYDNASRMAEEKILNSQNQAVIRDYKCTYTLAGMLGSVIDPATGSDTEFGYNSDEQEISESRTGLAPYSESFGYDSRGLRNSLTIASSGNTLLNASMTHDAAGQVTTMTDSSGNSDLQGNYTWNADGTLASYPGKGLTRVCAYDPWSRLTSISENVNSVQTTKYAYHYDNEGNLRTRADMGLNQAGLYDFSLSHGKVSLSSYSSDSSMQKWTANPSSASFNSGYSATNVATVYSPAGNEVLSLTNGQVTSTIESDSAFDTIFSGNASPGDYYHVSGSFNDEDRKLELQITGETPCIDYLIPGGWFDGEVDLIKCLKGCGSGEGLNDKCIEDCMDKFGKGVSEAVAKAIIKFLACQVTSSYIVGNTGKDLCTRKPMDTDICQDCCDEKFFINLWDCAWEDGEGVGICLIAANNKLTLCYASCDFYDGAGGGK